MEADPNPTRKNVFSEEKALTDDDIKKWCKQANLKYNVVDLDKLTTAKSRYCFVFTGNEENPVNKGNDHHWLFLDGKYLFDSYGNPKSYDLPEGFSMIDNNPRQLQQYNSTVCGEYCCAFYEFCSKNRSIKPEDIGEEFSDEFGLTGNRSKNDKIIYEWFHKFDEEDGKKSESGSEEGSKV